MYFRLSAVILTSQTGVENGWATLVLVVLTAVGAFLALSPVLLIRYAPPERLALLFRKGVTEGAGVTLRQPLVGLLFLGGLALLGYSGWLLHRSDLQDPSRIVERVSSGLDSLDKKTAALDERSNVLITEAEALSTGIDSAQQRVDKATKAAITLVLKAPPEVDLQAFDVRGGKVRCHYWLSSDPAEYTVQASDGPADTDIKCRIRNILPPAVIMRITVQEDLPDRTGQPKYIGYYTGADPAVPNYDLRPCFQKCP
jgi:hypothetical protein